MDYFTNIFGPNFTFGANMETAIIILVVAVIAAAIYAFNNKSKVKRFFKSTFGSKKELELEDNDVDGGADVFVVYSTGCGHCTGLHKALRGTTTESGGYSTPEYPFLKWVDSQHPDLGKLLEKAEIKEEEIPGVPFIFKIPKEIYQGDRSPESLIAFSKA
jgi:hypothetical protein